MADIDGSQPLAAPRPAASGAPAASVRRSSALLKTVLLSAGGESVQSAFHFALGILLIRALIPHDYGLYSVIFNLGGIALTYGNALMTVPSTVYLAHSKSPGAARFIESAFGSVALLVSVLLAVFVAIVLAAFSAPVATIPPASLFVGAWTLRNHLRLMAYASGHPFVATISDAVFSITGLGSVAILLLVTSGSPELPVLVWTLAGANVVACLAAVTQRSAPLRVSLRRSVRARYLKTWRDIAWSLFGVTTWNVQGQALTFLVAATHGVTAFAPIAAGIVVFRPFNTMVTAGINVLRPRLASDMARGRQSDALRTLLISMAIALTASAIYCTALWLAWPLLDRHVFAGRFPNGTMETIMPLVAVTMTVALSYHVPMSVVQAGRGFRSFALATTLGGLVGVAAISVILWVADTKWSLIGVLLGEMVCFAVLWSSALKLLLDVRPREELASAPPGAVDALRAGGEAQVDGKALVAIRVNPARDTQWARALAARIAARKDVGQVVLVAGAAETLPRPIATMLSFERTLLSVSLPQVYRTGDLALAMPAACDIAIDLSGSGPAALPGAALTLCPLYDGVADDAAIYANLLDGIMPVVEILDAGSGRVLARGTPGADCQSNVTSVAYGVLGRVATLVEAALDRPADLGPPVAPVRSSVGHGRMPTAMARRLAFGATGRLYRLFYHAPHWRIGFRFHDGPGVLERGDLGGAPWRVLADPGHRFFADPFPIWHEGRSYVFFEDYDHRSGKGIISYVEIGEHGPLGPIRPAVEEPWHLSYPFLFEDAGRIYMIPESCNARHVALYRAERFPDCWVREGLLLSDVDLSDATICRHDGRLWMFAAAHDGTGSRTDLLSIYSADRLTGPWSPHPLNPVLVDQRAARPAGNLVQRDGKLWRVAQDCTGGYGSALSIAEVLRLDETGYEQRLHAIVSPDRSWSGRRFHTLNRAGRLECIDGSAHSRKIRAPRTGAPVKALGKEVVDLQTILR